MRTFASSLLMSLLLCNSVVAQDFLLQLSIGETAGKLPNDTEPTSVEVHFTPGSTIYLRTVSAGIQVLLRGKIESHSNDDFRVKLTVATTQIYDGSKTENKKSAMSFQIARDIAIDEVGRLLHDDHSVQFRIRPLVPEIGYRDVSSGLSIIVRDHTGNPVPNVRAWLGHDDRIKDAVVGPVMSDANGLIRMSEGREELPHLLFYLHKPMQQLKTAIWLNRSWFNGPGYGKPIAVTTAQPK